MNLKIKKCGPTSQNSHLTNFALNQMFVHYIQRHMVFMHGEIKEMQNLGSCLYTYHRSETVWSSAK